LYVVLGRKSVHRLHGIELFCRLWLWEDSSAVPSSDWAERVGPLHVLPHLRASSSRSVGKAWEIQVRNFSPQESQTNLNTTPRKSPEEKSGAAEKDFQ
jgi:hypothetical protein